MTVNIVELIDKIDKDHSGEIEFDEFKLLLQYSGETPDLWKNWNIKPF